MAHFIVKKITDISTLKVGDELPESDYSAISGSNSFVQLEYIEDKEEDEVGLEAQPGIYSIIATQMGLNLAKTSFVQDTILEEFVHTKDIETKVESFFSKFHVYKKYGIEIPKRNILLYGPPGSGKSTALIKVATKYAKDNETVVITYATDKFDSYEVKSLIKRLKYNGPKKLILIVEDIGGVEIDEVKMRSDSSLLSLLDNQEKIFKIPTLIIATTNFPEVFLGNLTNRPGRFDDKIEVGYPDGEARKKLLMFFTQNQASPEAQSLMGDKKTLEFSPAHIKESIIRAELYDKTIEEVIKEMLKEIDLYKKAFSKKMKVGIGFDD
jgi:SpoVK/Ycf46/Vps4 family AAA+-type ATPase